MSKKTQLEILHGGKHALIADGAFEYRHASTREGMKTKGDTLRQREPRRQLL